MATYNVSNFINDPSEGDRLMFIYNASGQLTMTIDPYASTFFKKSKYVYIVTDGKMNYDNTLDFPTESDSDIAVARLNDVKKIFIDRTNNILNNCGGVVTVAEFDSHTANTNLHITENERATLNEVNNPSPSNPFATILDITGLTITIGDARYVKQTGDTMTGNLLMSADIIPTSDGVRSLGSSDYQWKDLWVSGGTIYMSKVPLTFDGENIRFSGKTIDASGNHGVIQVNSGLSFGSSDLFNYDFNTNTLNVPNISAITYYGDGTNLDGLVSLTMFNDYTGNTLTSLSAYTLVSDFNSHTGDTTIHFTKSSINLNDLGDVDTGGTLDGYYLSYSAGTWIGIQDSTDLSNYYTKQEVYNTGETYTKQELNNNFLSGDTTVVDLGGYSATTINILINDVLVSLTSHTSLTGSSNPHIIGFDDLSLTSHTHLWSDINITPTTISGYGITDAYTKSEINNNFLSANTSFYTQQEVNNNFLSADTSYTFDDFGSGVTYTGFSYIEQTKLDGIETGAQVNLTYQTLPTNPGIDNDYWITSNGDGTCYLSANTASFLNDSKTAITNIYIASNSALSLVDLATNYIAADRDTGTWISTIARSTIDFIRYLPYAEIYRSGNNLHIQMNQIFGYVDSIKNFERIIHTQPYARESGLDAIAVTSALTFTTNSGTIYVGLTEYNILSVSPTTLQFFCFNSGGTGTTNVHTNPVLNNTQYDNGTDLINLTPGYWTINYIYRGIELQDHVYTILGNREYQTVELAQASNTIGTLPDIISSHAMLLGRVIIQSGTTSNYTIESAFDTIYAGSSAISDHGALLGLGDDDHTQYHNDTRGDVRYYTKILLDGGQLDNRYYTSAQTIVNFLSANTSFYTQTESNNNFLSANTSFYTQQQSDSNYLSANTFDNQISYNINTTGNITASTFYGDGSNLSNLVIDLSGLTDTTINNPTQDDILMYSGGTWINAAPVNLVDITIETLNVTNLISTGITTNTISASTLYGDLDWNYITSTPTTISDYGITDAYTKTEVDNNFLSANTFASTIYTNGINNTGNITASTFYGNVDYGYITNLPDYTLLSDFNNHTGNTSNPHQTTYTNLLNRYIYNSLTASTYTLDSFASTTTDGCHWHYVIRDGANVEAGTVIGVWDFNSSAVTHTQYSTDELGSTSGVSFNVDINSGVVRLLSTIISGTWNIKIRRLDI